jgi:uncharacterized C2H2 Zn-finger protein
MPVTRLSKEYNALCYEHHVEMRLRMIVSKRDGENTRTFAYACAEPDCPVHYNISRGYFLLSQQGGATETELVPRVRCPQDGTPMYLAAIDLEKRDLRLWRCPQCDARRTNEDSLASFASQEIQDVSGKSGADRRRQESLACKLLS